MNASLARAVIELIRARRRQPLEAAEVAARAAAAKDVWKMLDALETQDACRRETAGRPPAGKQRDAAGRAFVQPTARSMLGGAAAAGSELLRTRAAAPPPPPSHSTAPAAAPAAPAAAAAHAAAGASASTALRAEEAQPSSTAVVGAKRYREVYEIPDDEPEVVADLVGQGVPESRIAEFARHEIAGLPRHGTSNALRLFKAIKLGLVEEALPELFEIIYGGALGELSE